MTKRRLRPLVWAVAPGLIAERDRRYQQRLRERLGFPQRAAGPVAGLRYPGALLPSVDAPLLKLQGEYERPLRDALDAVVAALRARPGALFVDAGSADGYYAVGIGRAAGCAVETFDLARSARRTTRALAAANGVPVRVRGRAREAALLRLAPDTAALLCDIDGGETAVVTERLARALAHAVVIVELHGEGPLQEIPERFRGTHRLEIVSSDPEAAEEMRGAPTPWLVARPRWRAGSRRASMQVTTANRRAGGIGRPPFRKAAA